MTFAITVDLKCDSCVGDGTDDSQCGGTNCHCCAGLLSKACSTPHRCDKDDWDDVFVASAERIRISHGRGASVPPLDSSPSLLAIFVPPSVIDPVIPKKLGGCSSPREKVSSSTEDQGGDKSGEEEKEKIEKSSAQCADAVGDGSASNSAAGGQANDEQDRLLCRPLHECSCISWLKKHVEDGCDAPLDDILPQIHPSLTGLIVKGFISTRRVSDAKDSGPSFDLAVIEVPKSNSDSVATVIDEVHGDCMKSVPHAGIKILPLSRISFVAPNNGVSDRTEEFESSTVTSDKADNPQQELESCDEAPGQKLPEIPSCPVCLHRIDPQRLGWPRPKNQQLCSQFCAVVPAEFDASTSYDACINTRYLTPWPHPSYCKACSIIWEQWKQPALLEAFPATGTFESAESCGEAATELRKGTRCYKCGMKETLWVCLTCGVIGCGRYSLAHAKEHNNHTGHPYSLELVTQRIWDYTTGEFAQRGDLLDCPSMRYRLGKNHHPREYRAPDSRSAAPIRKDADGFQDYRAFEAGDGSSTLGRNSRPVQPDVPSPKKASMIGEEYEALLQSALEDQAQHYEGEIARLIADLTAERVENEKMTDGEMSEVESLRRQISDLRSEADNLSRQLLEGQGQEAGHRATYQCLLREQQVSKDLLAKIKEEAQRESDEGKAQLEDMEQQVADLTANLKMARQIAADKELSNAQIFGTTSVPSTKPQKRGKKHRRMLRNK